MLVAASVLLAALLLYVLFVGYLPAKHKVGGLEQELKTLYRREAEIQTKLTQQDHRYALRERVLAWILAVGFLTFGVWALAPDAAEEPAERRRRGPLVATTVIFFFAEMGDKTQLATAALGARYAAPLAVTVGTTCGMLAADALAVFAGARLSARVPMRAVRRIAAGLFFLFGGGAIVRALGWA